MRPAVPPPDTPNEGRRKRYEPLVEPSAPVKHSRRVRAGLLAAGAAVVLVADALARVLT